MRHKRVRARVLGTKERPRVSVFKSNRYLFVQLVDDSSGKTIVSSQAHSGKKSASKSKKSESAQKIGEGLAKRAKEAGITEVIFDRGGYKYHGRVKSLADGLRAGGLKF